MLRKIIFPQTEEFELSEIPTNEDMCLFWSIFGSWQDNRTVEEIIKDIYASRTSTESRIAPPRYAYQ